MTRVTLSDMARPRRGGYYVQRVTDVFGRRLAAGAWSTLMTPRS